MKRLLALLFALCFAPAYAQNNATIGTQMSPDGSYSSLKILWPPTTEGLWYFNTGSLTPSYINIGTGLAVSGGALNVTTPAPTAFAYGYPTTRTLAVSTSYQANDNTRAAVITVSPQCTNATTVIAASACTLQARVNNSTATCANGVVVATWTSQYALGLLLTNVSGSPFDIKLPAGGSFILCPISGTFTFPTAVDQVAG